jgi:hypothetical protein
MKDNKNMIKAPGPVHRVTRWGFIETFGGCPPVAKPTVSNGTKPVSNERDKNR